MEDDKPKLIMSLLVIKVQGPICFDMSNPYDSFAF